MKQESPPVPDDGTVEELFFRYLLRSEAGRGIGFSSNLRIRCFLDLLTAAHDPVALGIMVRSLAALLDRAGIVGSEIGIMTPKCGNALLGRALADELGCSSGFFKADPLFGRWVEGPVAPDRRWVLVDDVASDGERLEDMVVRLRGLGIRISQAFFVVERAEGDVRESLAEVGVEVSAAHAVDDRGLDAISIRRRSMTNTSVRSPADPRYFLDIGTPERLVQLGEEAGAVARIYDGSRCPGEPLTPKPIPIHQSKHLKR